MASKDIHLSVHSCTGLGHSVSCKTPFTGAACIDCPLRSPNRFSKNEWSKIIALLGLALVLIYLGGLGLYSVSGRSLGDAFWEVCSSRLVPPSHLEDVTFINMQAHN